MRFSLHLSSPRRSASPVNGSQTLSVLWDSQQWNIAFQFNKFDPPIVDVGQIYVSNYNGGVDVYQLVQ